MNKLLAVFTLTLFTLTASFSLAAAKTPLEKTNVLVDILQKVATPAEGQKLNTAQKTANAKYTLNLMG